MTKPLTGDKLEIAILNAELRGFSELIDVWQAEAQRCARAIERVRELHKPYKFDVLVDLQACSECSQINRHGISVFSVLHPCPTIKALDGEQ